MIKNITQTKPRVRFAPSPTGRMHVGHLRAALPNALFALKNKGTFILRFEDTDIERQVADAEQHFLADMHWLGLEPAESISHGGKYGPYNTLARAERGDYQKAIDTLLAMGRAYECFTSPEELDVMRKLQRARNEPPRYDNRHRDLTEEQKTAYRNEGREPVIRFKLNDADITFTDLVHGEKSFHASNLGGDPVIVRSNGVPLFTLAGVVDDINMAITHVIRGEDHIANTAQQVQIFEALGEEPPLFAHLPMMLDKDGHKMSKRLGALTIHKLREDGYVPQAIVAYMASLGFGDGPMVGASYIDIAEKYDLGRINRAPVRFDEEQLLRVNAQTLHKLSYADVKQHLAAFLPAEAFEHKRLEAFWLAARENIDTLADARDLYMLAFDSVEQPVLSDDEQAVVKASIEHLPKAPFTADTWGVWTKSVGSATGTKGKGLFMPLRKALTGREHGPDMANLLPVIGAEATAERLTNALK